MKIILPHDRPREKLARVGPAALEILRAQFEIADPPLRGRLLRAIGRMTASSNVRSLLIGALNDSDAKTRRNAAIALGRDREGRGVEDALIRSWDRDPRPEMRRSIAASLGKVGSSRSLAILRDASSAEDAPLARIAERAVSMIERTQSRSDRFSRSAEYNRPYMMAFSCPSRPGPASALMR